MRFLKHLFYAIVLVGCIACGPDSHTARIEGRLKHVQRAELYLYCAYGATDRIDTLHIERGKIKEDIALGEPCLYTLLLQNFTSYSLVLEPGKTFTIDGDGQKLAEMTISGNEDNELLTAFRKQILGKRQDEIQRAAVDFVHAHPKSLAAIGVVCDVFLPQEQPNRATVKELLEVLRKAQPKQGALAYVEQALNAKMYARVGDVLPSFSATALDGSVVDSHSLQGKPLVICFTATWTQSYNEMNRALHEARPKLPEGTKMVVMSLDTDVGRMRDRIATDSLPASFICDGKAFDSPLVTTFGITALPSVMLVGSDGRIQARDIASRKLGEALSKFR